LVEINTTASIGNTYKAAPAIAARVRASGCPDSPLHVFNTAPRSGNSDDEYLYERVKQLAGSAR